MSKRRTKIEPPFWQASPCPSWCDGGHHLDDNLRTHEHGFTWSVPLSTHKAMKYRGGGSDKYGEPALWFGLEQGYREIEPRVCVSQGLGTEVEQVELYLTLREAERLAKYLLRAVKRAGGTS